MQHPLPPFESWLQTLSAGASAQRWRTMVVLAGSRAWSREQCASSSLLLGDGCLWLSDVAEPAPWTIPAAQATSLLGTETRHLVVDAWSGFHPSGIAAITGTLRAGGLLVLLVPPLDEWPDYSDPDYQRLAAEGCQPNSHRFLHHLAQTLVQDERALIWREGQPLPELPATEVPVKTDQSSFDIYCATNDQAVTVDAIMHVVTGHRDRPLVVTADRGRGKSAALGIAAARLLQAGQLDEAIITAPLASGVESALQHANRVEEGSATRLRYLPPDELLRTLPATRLLMVDEAAAIPAHLLSKMLDHYRRIVFTTTVHGYEGTGRGFAVRFMDELARRKPQARHLSLGEPIRWAQNDPLETCVRKLLWLDAQAADDAAVAKLEGSDCVLETLDRDQLLNQPQLMQQLMGLLTTAHYRTTPDDARLILDAPNMGVLLARAGQLVLGALLFAEEGTLDASLVASICDGQRRPRGHLLPQSLWAQTGSSELLSRKGLRVVRIAVHPAMRRQQLGSELLQQLQVEAGARGASYLGTSFGATEDLLGFWFGAGYLPLAIGWRRDAASGSHGLLLVKALDAGLMEYLHAEHGRFSEVFPELLADQLQRMEMELVVPLLQAMPAACYTYSSRDEQDATDFSSGARSYEHCAAGVRRVALALLADPTRCGEIATLQRLALVSRVLQRNAWHTVAEQTGRTGKAAVQQALRDALRTL